jgi:CubicO group peptidase (beta-lactamase class C family)
MMMSDSHTTRRLASLTAHLSSAPAAGSADDWPSAGATAVGTIEQLLHQHPEVPSLAVAVAVDGNPVFARAWGLANRETGRAATPDTPYSLASISKPLTATG